MVSDLARRKCLPTTTATTIENRLSLSLPPGTVFERKKQRKSRAWRYTCFLKSSEKGAPFGHWRILKFNEIREKHSVFQGKYPPSSNRKLNFQPGFVQLQFAELQRLRRLRLLQLLPAHLQPTADAHHGARQRGKPGIQVDKLPVFSSTLLIQWIH